MDEKSGAPPAYNTQPYSDNPSAYPPQQQGGYPQQQGGYPQQQPGYPPAQGYAAYPAPGTTVAMEPGMVVMHRTPLPNPPPDHLVYAIFVTICCCWPIGIFAIIKSVETRDASNRGDMATAQQKSKEAKKFGNWALGAGIVALAISVVIIIIYVVIVFVTLANANIDNHSYDSGDYRK